MTVVATSGARGHLAPDADLLTDLSGWVGGVGVRGERTERSGHGEFPAPSFRTGRTITLGVSVEREDVAGIDAWQRTMSGLFADGGFGTLSVESSGLTLSAEVQLDGEVKIEANRDYLWGNVQVPLHAPDPVLYGEERVTFLRPAATGVGLRFPLFSPNRILSFGSAVRGDDPVVNAGTVAAWPTFLVVGNFPGGVEITASGRTVAWPWPITTAAPVEIRMSGSVWIGDANVTAQATRREWSSIPPGGRIAPTFSPLQGGDGWCEVHHRDTYM